MVNFKQYVINKLKESEGKIKLLRERPYTRNLVPKTLNADLVIYRIETLEHFRNNYVNNDLYFSHPLVWLKGDELDSFLVRKRVVLPSSEDVSQGYFDETFCQCWSKANSDKMWEIYGKDPNFFNVAMVSSIDKLMKAFEKPQEINNYSSIFWAVEASYEDFQDDQQPFILSEENVLAFFSAQTIASLYSPKRLSYGIENEIRFIVNCRKEDRGKSFTKVKLLDPLTEVLSGLKLDPRLSPMDRVKMLELLKKISNNFNIID